MVKLRPDFPIFKYSQNLVCLRNFLSIVLFASVATSSISFAQSELPQFFTLDGRLFEAGSATEPLLDGSVVMTVQILNPAKTCILYEETETVSTLATNGYFTARIGSAPSAPERASRDSNNSMTTVFVNAAAPITGQTSSGGACTYTPAAGDVREFRFFITPSTVGSTAQLSDDMTVDSVPQALVAQTLRGLGPSNFFQTSVTSTQAKLDNLLTTNYSTLSDVISGTSSLYLQNSAVGTQLPTRATDPVAPAPGQMWYDTATNEVKYFNGTTIEAVGTGGAGVTAVTAGAGLSGGTISTTGTIAIDAEGVATGMIADGAVTDVKLATGIDAAKITVGTLPAGVVPTGTDNTKLPLDGSAAMTGALDLGANNLLNTGHITMNAQRTITIGRYDAGQQTTLIGTLGVPNAGASWYNTTTGKLMYWNGTAALELSESTTAGGDITAINTNAGSGLTGGVTSGPATLAVNVDGTTLEVATNTVQVKDAGIDANKLAAGAVTNGKLAADAVTSDKILNGEITDADINAAAAIAWSKIDKTGATAADVGAVPTARQVNTNAGSGLTGGGDLSANRSLSLNVDDATIEIATNTVQLKDGGIATAKIANSAITDAKIDTVSVNKITSALGQYFTYAPNGGACAPGEVLKKTVNGWECGTDATGAGVTDHGALTGLGDDDHTQYVMLAGRAGGQNLRGGTAGGENLTLESTSNATKGDVLIQPTDGNVGIGTTAPDVKLDVEGTIQIGDGGETCTIGANAGMVKYAAGALQYCNGSAWQTLGVSGAGLTNLNAQTGSSQTFAAGASGLAPGWSSAADVHTFNIPLASGAGVTSGTISKVDYDAFSAKLSSVTGSALTSARLWVGDGTNLAQPVLLSGDVTMSNTGVVTIANDAITTVKIDDDAVTTVKIAADAVTTAKIDDDTITNADINSAAAIAWTKIDKTGATAADVGAVPTSRNINTNAGSGLTGGGNLSADRSLALNVDGSTIEIATNTVQVKDGGIATAKIANSAVTDAKIDTVSVNKVTSALGQYFTYAPNGGACAPGEVLKKTINGWECGTDATGGGVTDHGALTGLGDDDHTQYVMLAGRAGGQNLRGGTASGDDLTIESTSDATKGDILLQPNGGNVGLGTTLAGAKLHIYDSDTSTTLAVVNSTSSAARYPAVRIANHGNGFGGAPTFYFSQSEGTASAQTAASANATTGQFVFQAHDGTILRDVARIYGGTGPGFTAGDHEGFLAFLTGDAGGYSERMRINHLGNVGIGTTAPASKLDIEGTIQIGDGGETCTIGANAGMVKYAAGALQYCNGSAWQTLGVSGAGLTTLNAQTGSTQTFATGATGLAPAWSSATNVHTLNIPLASGAGVTSGTISKVDYDAFTAKLSTVTGSALTSARLWVGDGTNLAQPVLMSGDVTMSNTGAVTIANNAITSAKINDGAIVNADINASAAIAWSKIDKTGAVAADVGAVATTRAINTNSGSGLTGGGDLSADRNIAMNVDNSTIEIATNTVQVKDSGITNAKIASVGISKITSGATEYFGYMPAGSECNTGEVLKWDAVTDRWNCGTDNSGASDHGALTGLGDDDHTQYVMLAGRAGGQNLRGGTASGEDLTIESTSNATKGDVIIQPTGGNVGIGTTSPATPLHLQNIAVNGEHLRVSNGASAGTILSVNTYDSGSGGTNSNTDLNLFSKNNDNYGGGFNMNFARDSAGVPATVSSGDSIGTIAWSGYDGSAYKNSAYIYASVDGAPSANNVPGSITFSTHSGSGGGWPVPRMTIKSSGNVGVGTTAPTTKLDIEGTIQIGDGGETCSIAANAGMVKYAAGTLQYCNGSSWQTLGVSGAGLTTLNAQTGSTQTFATGATGLAPAWSSATNVHTLNIPLASGAGVTSGTISKVDYDAFTAKLSAVTGSALTSARLWVGDGSNLAQPVLLSGDATMSNTGAVTIANNAITSAKINDGAIVNADINASAAIAWSKIDKTGAVAADVGAVATTRAINTNSGSGLTGGGDLTADRNIAMNVDNSTIEIATNTVQVKNSGITNAKIASMSVSKITSGATEYFSYMPASSECNTGEVLKWDAVTDRWNCGTDSGGVTDHGALTGLGDDDHTQYVMLAGRSGGQTLRGGTASGDDLTIESTSNATKGDVIIQPNGGNIGIGTASPNSIVNIKTSVANDGVVLVGASNERLSLALNAGVSAWNPMTLAGDKVLMYGGSAVNSAGGFAIVPWRNTGGIATGIRMDQDGNVGIGTSTPSAKLHISDSSPTVRVSSTSDGTTAIDQSTPGVELLAQGMNVTNKYTPAIRFSSTDLNFTTQNPKFLAGIVGRATENYAADTDGGMAIDFMTSPNDVGASSVPSVRMTIDQSGNVGVGTTTPAVSLDFNTRTDAIRIPAGTTAQQPTAANGMIRYNTTNNKFEGYENGAWVNLRDVASGGVIGAGAGSVSAPSLSFSTDPNTGFYSNGGDVIGVAANGANIFNMSSAGIVSPTTGGGLVTTANGTVGAPTYSFAGDPDTGWWRPAADTMAASTGGVEAMRINPSGNVGIGTTSDAYPFNVYHLDTSTTGTAVTSFVTTHARPTATTTATIRGFQSSLTTAGGTGHNQSGFHSVLASATHGDTGAVDTMIGAYGLAQNTSTGSVSNLYGTYGIAQNTSTGSVTGMYGARFSAQNDSTGSVGTIAGIHADAVITAGTPATNNYGSFNRVNLVSTGTAPAVHGSYNTVQNSSTGTITDGYGIRSIIQNVSTGTITTAYGNYIQLANDSGGTVNNWYGLFLTDEGTNANYYSIYTAGSTKSYFGGNVGIGTTAPSAPVHILKTSAGAEVVGLHLQNSSSTTNTGVTLELNPTNQATGIRSSQIAAVMSPGVNQTQLVFRNSNANLPAEVMRLDNTGRMGLGTDNPSYLLSLGGDTARTIGMERTTASASAGNDLNLTAGGTKTGETDQNGGNLVLMSGAATGTGSSQMQFRTTTGGTTGTANRTSTTKMTLTGAGDLGIGTTTPVSLLDISAAGGAIPASAGVLTLSRADAGVASADTIGKLQFWNNDSTLTTQNIYADIEVVAAQGITTDAAAGTMIFRTTGTTLAGTPQERMRIAASGNVGINSTNPGVALDVVGTIRATAFSGGYAAGTAGAPSLNFSGDPDTGFFNALSDNTISITNGGTKTFDITSDGLISPTTGGGYVKSGNGTEGAPTFSFAGDPDTGWWRPAADTIAASTAGAERLRINSTGNVGIGTTNPTTKLQVEGGLAINGSATAAGTTEASLKVFAGADTSAQNAASFNYSATNNSGVTVNMNKSRGTATAPLTVANGDAVGTLRYRPYDGTNYLDTARVSAEVSGAVSSGNVPTDLLFYTGSSAAPTEKMRITSSGSVGIGASPAGAYKLDVTGDAIVRNSLYLEDSFRQLFSLETNSLGLSSAQNVRVYVDSANNSGDAFVVHGNVATGTTVGGELLSVLDTGRVGVGTTAPGAKFQVVDTNTATAGNISNNYSLLYAAPTGASSGSNYASYNLLSTSGSGANDISLLTGSFNRSYHIGTGVIAIGYGADNRIDNAAAGTITNARGSFNYANNASTGTITSGYGAYNYAQNSGGGEMTNAYGTYSIVNNTSGTSTAGYGVYARVYGAGTYTDAYGVYIGDQTGTNQWGLYQSGATDSNYFAGDVGIGTTVPVSKLNVSGATGSVVTLSRADTTAANTDSIGLLQFWNNDAQLTTQNIYANIEVIADQAITTDAAAGAMLFRTTGPTLAGTPQERMRIDSDGNVGIGTTNPAVRTHIYDATPTDGSLRIENSNIVNTAGIDFYTAGTSRGFVGWRGTSSSAPAAVSMYLWNRDNSNVIFGTNNAERVRIDQNGNVGIGTNLPTAKLEIAGTAGVDGIKFPDGTTQVSAATSTVTVPIKYTRTTVAYNASNATKDAQCNTEFGSKYVAASALDVEANLLTFGSTGVASYFVVYGNTVNRFYLVNGEVNSNGIGTHRLACILTTARIRFTRTAVAHSATNVVKDAQCSTEFGSQYQALSDLEVASNWTGGGANDKLFVIYDNTTNSFGASRGTDGTLTIAANSTGSFPVICGYK